LKSHGGGAVYLSV